MLSGNIVELPKSFVLSESFVGRGWLLSIFSFLLKTITPLKRYPLLLSNTTPSLVILAVPLYLRPSSVELFALHNSDVLQERSCNANVRSLSFRISINCKSRASPGSDSPHLWITAPLKITPSFSRLENRLQMDNTRTDSTSSIRNME